MELPPRSGLRIWSAATVLLAVAAFLPPTAARVGPTGPAPRGAGFDLLAPPVAVLQANRVLCGLDDVGGVCFEGMWPRGSAAYQYIFSSGLQVAGRIPASAGFAWAGDTVGAFFVDGRGTQEHGAPLTAVHDSRSIPDARSAIEARVRSGAPFHPALSGRFRASEQDLWVRLWDGDPTLLSGRTHPMGIVVDLRAMAWGYPAGNDDIVYFVYDVYNVSASDPAAYAALGPGLVADLAQVGRRFQQGVEAELGVNLPDGGYRLDSLYAALFMDADVEDASRNYSTAVLPFDAAATYKHTFTAPSWRFPADIFSPPFARAPGFVGGAFLAAPADATPGSQSRTAMYTEFTGAATGFPEPVGVQQLWRYLSGQVSQQAGDNPCTVVNPALNHLCYLNQIDRDTRFAHSTGPFSLAPGERATVAMAYVLAAPVAAAIQPGVNTRPGIPPAPDSLVLGTDTLRVVDRAMGWLTHADLDGNGRISAREVTTVPRSYLHKVQIAQAIADAGFRLAAPPESPNFFLVPGDRQATVVWEPSATERVGDPYAASAGDPASPLFDPNFRAMDVEGYRIYRGLSPSAMELIAQFDYDGTTFVDRTGALDYGQCAPELGVTTQCPVAFDYPPTLTGPSSAVSLTGDLVQVAPGNRILLPDGAVHVLLADTAIRDEARVLSDTRVPFAFVDSGLVNAVRYYYAVTAFDVNSVASSRTSLESPRGAKATAPRGVATNVIAPTLGRLVTGDDGVPLDTTLPWPGIDPDDGTFSGNLPPRVGGTLDLPGAVLEALAPGDIGVRTDSVGPGFMGGIGPAPPLYTTWTAGGRSIRRTVAVDEPEFSQFSGREYAAVEPLVPFDSARSRIAGLDFRDTTVRMPAQLRGVVTPVGWTSEGIALAVGRYGTPFGSGGTAMRYLAHSRWFVEGESEPPDPTIVAGPDPAHHAGTVSGVLNIWSPAAYRVPPTQISALFRGKSLSGATGWYPADFVVTWESGGTLSVRDVTHRVTLPFTATGGSGWGFLTLANVLVTGLDQPAWDARVADGVGAPRFDVINYQHLYLTRPTCSDWWSVPEYCVALAPAAEIQPLDFDTDGTTDGNGFVLLVNGEPFFMETPSPPAPGTQWHLRAVTGVMTADCTPALGPVMTDCTNYTFAPHPVAPDIVPGLRYVIRVDPAFTVAPDSAADLSRVHTVPDPYYVSNGLEQGRAQLLRFVNLPARAIIRIYSVSGVLVAVLEHDQPTGGGEAAWNLRTRNDRPVASGVYFYHLETPNGQQRVGRFTIVQGQR
jgi:hypothetical protein